MQRVWRLIVFAVVLGAACTSPASGGGSPAPAYVVPAGGTLEFSVSNGGVGVTSLTPSAVGGMLSTSSNGYTGDVEVSVGPAALWFRLGLVRSGNRLSGLSVMAGLWPGTAKGAEFNSAVLHVTHTATGVCPSTGLQLSANGRYWMGGAVSDFSAQVTLVLCDPQAAAYFVDS